MWCELGTFLLYCNGNNVNRPLNRNKLTHATLFLISIMQGSYWSEHDINCPIICTPAKHKLNKRVNWLNSVEIHGNITPGLYIYIYTILVISNYSPKARVHLNRNFKRVFLRISIKIGKYVLRRIRPMFYFRIELIFKFPM